MTLPDLQAAGRLLREHVLVPERPASAVSARVALVGRLARSQARARAWRLASVVAAALALTMPLGWLLYPSSWADISFSVGPEGRAGKIGAYVSPPAGAYWKIAFSDGSRVTLQPLSHARVTRTTPHGAEVLLENGQARLDVVHRPKTTWSVIAGPYTVRITGTSFDVSFDAHTQTLEVLMRSGAVRVEGPGIDNPVGIRGAQRFVHHAGTANTTAAAGVQRSPAEPASLDAPENDLQDSALSEPTDAPSTDSPAKRPSASGAAGRKTPADRAASWAQLAHEGSYQTVVDQAEQQGLSKALSSAPARELMALGHAARFVGRTDVASRAYRAVRARFRSSQNAAAAAFFLGRMVELNPKQAVRWYERYVAEAPSGSWISEALGRRMVLLSRSGAKKASLEAARTYLLRFPRGPYAGVAREMTAEF